jgi:hypothetical protein
MRCERFGVFSAVNSVGTYRRTHCNVNALLGRDLPRLLDPTLTLTGHIGGLVVDNYSKIEGPIVFHHGQVLKGKRKTPANEYSGSVTTRISASLPFDIAPLVAYFREMKDSLNNVAHDTNAGTGGAAIGPGSGISDAIRSLKIKGDCTISGVELENRRVFVDGALTISPETVCRGCTFLARTITVQGGSLDKSLCIADSTIHISSGFHNSQFFSLDSICIGNKSRTGPLSVWVSWISATDDSTVKGGIYFESEGHYSGTALCFTDTTDSNAARNPELVDIRIDNNCTFSGNLITDGYIQLNKISLSGHIWARTLFTLENKASYKNYLFQSELKPPKTYIPFPLLGEMPVKIRSYEISHTYRRIGGS